MALPSDVLQQWLQATAATAQPALERYLDHALAGLQAAEVRSTKVGERDQLASAWRLLRANKAEWTTRYPAQLQEAFNQRALQADQATKAAELGSDAVQARRPAKSSKTALDAFTLVDDAEVAQAIASTRLQQNILPRLEQALAELDTLISTAQGLANVRFELNPLRPEVYAREFQDMLATAAAEPAAVAPWIGHLADPRGKELLVS